MHESKSQEVGLLPPAELIDLHCETLYVMDDDGDMIYHNSPHAGERRIDHQPHAPERRRCCRLHIGWNDEGLTYRFRHDVPADVRERFVSWLKSNSPVGRDDVSGLDELCGVFGVSTKRAGAGPAYHAASVLSPSETSIVTIDRTNETLLKEGYLVDGGIDVVQPCCAVVVDERAVSVCLTVRRSARTAEAGLDTEPEFRGRGYAGLVTAAWARGVQVEGRIPFYSTESDNAASQRVAEKLGLIQIGWELGIG